MSDAQRLHDTVWLYAVIRGGTLTRNAVKVHIQDAVGAGLVDTTADIAPRLRRPNGEGCEPAVWQAGAVVGSDGSVQEAEEALGTAPTASS